MSHRSKTRKDVCFSWPIPLLNAVEQAAKDAKMSKSAFAAMVMKDWLEMNGHPSAIENPPVPILEPREITGAAPENEITVSPVDVIKAEFESERKDDPPPAPPTPPRAKPSEGSRWVRKYIRDRKEGKR